MGTSPTAVFMPCPGDRSGGMLRSGVTFAAWERQNLKGLKAEELGLKEQVDICGVFFLFLSSLCNFCGFVTLPE